MKKFFLLIGAVMCVSTITAQSKLEWGVHAGLNLANEKVSTESVSAEINSHAQFHLGFSVAAPIGKKLPFYFATGLEFTGRGGESKNSGNKLSDNLYYLQIPVSVSYHFNLGEKVSLQPQVGIYYALGLFSNTKVNGEPQQYDGENFDFFTEYNGEQGYKSSDLGLRFGVDALFSKHYKLGLGYDLGLLNINKDMFDGNIKVTNGVFYIRLGYNF